MPFIVMEGMDGSGKSTQAKMLYERMKEEGKASYLTLDPGGTKIGQKIRQLLLDPANSEMTSDTELFLYMASRCQLMEEIICPKLAQGEIVISDRFLLSSLVYQGIAGKSGQKKVETLGKIATKGVEPHIILILNVSTEVGLSRLPKEKKLLDRMELKGKDYHQKIQKAYLELAQNFDQSVIIDGNGSPKEVHLQIMDALKNVIYTNHGTQQH